MKKLKLGEGNDINLTDALDLIIPYTQGFFARVFTGFFHLNGNNKRYAVKIMRPERMDSIDNFIRETRVLKMLDDVEGITRMLYMGMIKLDEKYEFPSHEQSARGLEGNVDLFLPKEIDTFSSQLPEMIEQGWLPFITLELRSEPNLYTLCDRYFTAGKYLDLNTGIKITIQICDILEKAHKRGILLTDYKIAHFYWQDLFDKVYIIDWNCAVIKERPLTEGEIGYDLAQFGARTLYHLFTGSEPSGAPSIQTTDIQEVLTAPSKYRSDWDHDTKERLSASLMDFLSKLMDGQYSSVNQLKQDLSSEVKKKLILLIRNHQQFEN